MDPLVDCPREGEFSTVFLQEHFEEFLSRLAVCAAKQVSILSCSELQAGDLAFTERSCRNTSSIWQRGSDGCCRPGQMHRREYSLDRKSVVKGKSVDLG